MKYFRLYPTVKLVSTCKNSCLYDFVNGLMIKLDDKTNQLLNNYSNGIDETDESINILNKLEELGLGFYTHTIKFQEDFENTDIELRKVIMPSNNTIQKVFIELGSECNLDCIICNRDDNLYRKTGCKKWPRYEKKLNMDHWDEILNDLSKLKSNQLCFIGGNPLLRIERVNEIIEVSKKYGFNTFVIYSNGTIIDDNVIKILKENNIILSIQILSFNPNTLLKLGLDPQIEKEIKNNIERLIEAQVNFVVQILVNRYNEDEIDDIRNILKNEYNISNIVSVKDLVSRY